MAQDPEVTLQLLNDQEIADAAKDPEGMAVIQDAPRLHSGLAATSRFPNACPRS